MKEAATTIKKRTDATKEDLAQTQPANVTDSLRRKADALRKEVCILFSSCFLLLMCELFFLVAKIGLVEFALYILVVLTVGSLKQIIA